MGNRAVITTKKNWQSDGVGIYLHWNGGKDSVTAFLKYCELKGFRSPSEDNYGWANLGQVIANFFGGGSIGIDRLSNLDCDNFDNGVYIIEGWEIVDRKHFSGAEQDEYDLNEMLLEIDSRQPEHMQLGEFLKAEPVEVSEIKVGDTVYFLKWSGEVICEKVLGVGEDRFVNGTNVKGIPYIGYYGEEPEDNINNYLIRGEYRRKK